MPPAARAHYKEYHPNEVSMTEALNYRYGADRSTERRDAQP
jgi:hypothetical protein